MSAQASLSLTLPGVTRICCGISAHCVKIHCYDWFNKELDRRYRRSKKEEEESKLASQEKLDALRKQDGQ